MARIEKMLKEGKAKIHHRNVLTPEQQQKLDKDSKTIVLFIRKLWERIINLRQQVRALNGDQKIVQTKTALKSAGGEMNVSFLDESDVNIDSSANASLLAAELMSSMTIVDNGKKSIDCVDHSKNIPKLYNYLENASTRPKKVIQVVSIESLTPQRTSSDAKLNSSVLKPKVAEAQKALIDNLMKAQSPRSMIQKIPPQPVATSHPLNGKGSDMFHSKKLEFLVSSLISPIAPPAVSTPVSSAHRVCYISTDSLLYFNIFRHFSQHPKL